MAIATPPGTGALGVVRLSGPGAVALAGTLLGSHSIDAQASHTIRKVQLVDPDGGGVIDTAVCAVMRAPRSYTGEDIVELSCHGGPAVLAMVVERLRRAGARLAAPGEFTRRAYLNGRLDLAQAEAVALLINARTERAVTLAARALEGELAARIHVVRDATVDVVAGLEVALDFPDDGVGLDIGAACARVQQLATEVRGILAAARRGRLVHDGMTIAIVGRPNAGKSSLLNALLGRDRAIVSATPGTTRDVVEGVLAIHGVPVRVLDTAGLAPPNDTLEAEGMKRSVRALEESDVALVVVDGSVPVDPGSDLAAIIGNRRMVLVRSKADLPPHAGTRVPSDAIAVSSTTGEGLGTLLERLGAEIVHVMGADGGEVAATVRQISALEEIACALDAAGGALQTLPIEAALVDLRDALAGTSLLLGLEVGDAVLDRIFSTFCVGK